MKDEQLILQPLQSTASSTASDSAYILQTKSVEVVDRPRLEHLKYYFLGKIRPFQFPLLAVFILLSLAILLRKLKRKK